MAAETSAPVEVLTGTRQGPGKGLLDKKSPSSESSYQGVSPQNDANGNDFQLSRRGILIFTTLAVLTLMVALDGTSISVALPVIAQSLNGSAIEAFWSGTSFLLSSTVFQPIFASFSNIFGRKPLFLIALLFFFVGALVAGIAKDFTYYMLAGRTIQGVGGGGLIVLSEIIVTDIVPLRQRGNYYGILGAMWSLGSVIGPILGGGFSQNVTWRWIFFINFPFIGVGFLFLVLFLNLNFVPSSLLDKLRQVDYVGIVIFIGSLASFLIPLTWGGVVYPWSSFRTLVPLVIGIVGLAAFAVYEYWFTSNPIIPHSIFLNRSAVVSFVGSTIQGLILWCLVYYLPLYYEGVKGYSPILSGIAVFPETFTVAPSAVAVGIAISWTGRYRWGVWLGWGITTLGLGLLCLLKEDTSIVGWIFPNIVGGLGLGALMPALGFAIQASVSDENISMAVAMGGFFRALGQALGVAVGGVIFQNRMRANLLGYPAFVSMADSYSRDAASLIQILKAMPDDNDKFNLQQAYADSLRIVWAVCCAISAAAWLLSFLTESYDLNRALTSTQGLRTDINITSDEEKSGSS